MWIRRGVKISWSSMTLENSSAIKENIKCFSKSPISKRDLIMSLIRTEGHWMKIRKLVTDNTEPQQMLSPFVASSLGFKHAGQTQVCDSGTLSVGLDPRLLTWCSGSVKYLDLSRWVRPRSCLKECSPSWWPSGGRGRRRGPRWCPARWHGQWPWSWGRSRRQEPECPRSPLWWAACGTPWPRSPEAEGRRREMIVNECKGRLVMLHVDALYLGNRQHSLIIVWVGLDFEAQCGITVNYRVHRSPRPGVWVVPVVHGQVDHHSRRALVHVRLKLLQDTDRHIATSKQDELR